jgi:hypothetical protein
VIVPRAELAVGGCRLARRRRAFGLDPLPSLRVLVLADQPILLQLVHCPLPAVRPRQFAVQRRTALRQRLHLVVQVRLWSALGCEESGN